MTNKRVLYIVLFMHTMFFMCALIFLKMQRDKNISKYLKQLYFSDKTMFDKEITLLNKDMDLLEQILIDKKIVKIVENAYIDFNLSRKRLIKTFMPKYLILKKNGFYLVHFHLLNGISLVRFHNLNEYNDSLNSFRPSIKFVQKNGKIYHGFEIGKGAGGFRSVYPLIDRGKVVGSFEISFSIKNLINYVLSNERFAVVVKKSIIDKRVFKKELKKFKICKLNSDYYIWGNICGMFNGVKKIDFDNKINIRDGKIIFSYPIYDLSGKKEGYIITVIPENNLKVIKEIKNNFKNITFIVFFLYFVILFMILAVYYFVKLKTLAERDYLTKLLNRKGCMKNLKKLKNYSLLVMDIDHFKKINDTYGHDTGDFVLKEVSKLLNENLRDSDIICRWGGEEFLIILPNKSIDVAVKVAEKLRKLISMYDFKGLKVTVSIGVSEFKDNFETTFKNADEKLYIAKKSGRNRTIF